MRSLWRAGLALASVNLLVLAVALYLGTQLGPILSAKVANDGCEYLDSAGHVVRTGSDAAVRPNPLDPDCVYGGMGNTPVITADEAAAARNPWPRLPYLLILASAVGLFVLALTDPGRFRRLSDRLRERPKPTIG